MDIVYLFLVFLAMAIVSFGERALPFVAGKWLQRQKWARTLGDFLPLSIMVLLLVHSATDAAMSHEGLPVAEVAAIVLTAVLQWWIKNPLLSIFAGTALYVVLRNGLIPGVTL